MKKNETIFGYIICFYFMLLFCLVTVYTREPDTDRGLSDEYRERILQSATVNREIGRKLEECREITARINDTNNRNIGTAREAVEVIEQLRVQVQELNDCIESVNWDEYYQYWDNYLGIDTMN